MNFELRELKTDAYAAQVLPATAPLWAHGRPLEKYTEQIAAVAASPYGRKYYRTYGLVQDGALLASFKQYHRTARLGNETLLAAGFGAVFTPEELRGRGYASAMLAMALDRARAGGFDFAFLFSDIHPQFYKELGFFELSSRSISVRADTLGTLRLTAEPIGDRDWTAVRKCFDAVQETAQFGLIRTPLVWDFMRLRLRQDDQTAHAQPVNLAARNGRTLLAYVLGRREPQHDAYVVDEYGFLDERGEMIVPSLLRVAAGDLRRVAGWLPPPYARDVLPRGSVRRRSEAIFMIAPLSAAGARYLKRAKASGSADPVWSLDHI